MSKIVVVGDSWGDGIWKLGDPNPAQGAFPDLLANNGRDVINLSIAGNSNFDTFSSLSSYLALNGSSDISYVIWIQTDPMRDFRTAELSVIVDNISVPIYNFLDLKDFYTDNSRSIERYLSKHLDTTYFYLDRLARQYNLIIHCLGGCSKLSGTFTKFKNLNPLIPSIPELLIDDHNDSVLYNTESWLSYQLPNFLHSSMFDIKGLKDWEYCYKIYEQKVNAWSESNMFKLDQSHPDHQGHEMIFRYLVKKLRL